MTKYQVIKPFVYLGITRKQGDTIDLTPQQAGKLLQYKLIGLAKENAYSKAQPEIAGTTIQAELIGATDEETGGIVVEVVDEVEETEEIEPKHLGGGYYELPDGTKIKGKQNAIDAMKEGE